MFYKMNDLCKVHMKFYHPESQRPYSVLRRAGPDPFDPDKFKKLEVNGSSYDFVQRLSAANGLFTAIILKNIYC